MWSEWAGPYVPQSGISCVEFSSAAAGEEWMKVGWLEPQLYNKRKVTAFELQVSQPLGPLCRQFSIYKKADDIMDGEIAAGDSISYEFQTLTNDTKESHYVIKNIKPGNRYQYRVRPQINNEWLGWDFGMLSDVIVVPPCAPDPPTDVHLWNSSDQVKAADPTPADTPGSSISFDNEGVGHDFIVIAYTAGNSGGAPVIEYGMECARIRDYDYNDVMNAEQAAGRQASLDTVTNGRLQWEDVTPNATMMGPCAFKINHLLVGSHYVFRVKQKNEVGWSMFSLASPIMSTCHTPPPDTPIVTEIGTTFAVLKWTVSCAPNTETAPVNKSGRPSIGQTVSQKLAKDLNNFTVLDYQVAVGHLPTDDMAGVITSNINSKDIGNNVTLPNIDVEALSTNISWIVGYTRTYDDRKYLNGKLSGPDSGGINENGDVVSCVLLENLAASSYYIVRVKVLTVAGWSPWSKASDVFRASSVQ